MRRLSRKMRERLLRKQRYVERMWEKCHQKSRHLLHCQEKRATSGYLPPLRYWAPDVVTMDYPEYRSGLLKLLADLRGHFKNHPSRTALIDFRRTRHFVAGGTLLLYAELNRLLAYSSNTVKLRCTEPASSKASEVLKQVGIYRLCCNRCAVSPNSSDVVHWQVAQGQLVDNSLCAPTIEGFQGRLSADMVDELLGGLGEAMTNAIHHAYDGVRQDGLDFASGTTDWWMFSQAKDGTLSVVFCDLGIGIPASLPLKRPSLFEKLVHRQKAPTDFDCISEAIIEGRTRTRLDGRGYGLGNIVDVVENVPSGVVIVYSNHGRYDSRSDSGFPNNYGDSILGTVICWSVPMEKRIERSGR